MIAFPIHVWAILNLFNIIPAWLLKSSFWELCGAIGYTLAGALFESLIVWALFLILGILLPRSWFARKQAALSGSLAWVLAGWAILAQYKFSDMLQLDSSMQLAGLFLVILSCALVFWLVSHYGFIEQSLQQVAQRLEILTYLYVFFDMLGLVVVILRNV
jgi:hypothetical protein